MAEAEEVVSDVARHATVFARNLWRRHGKQAELPEVHALGEVTSRLDLFVTSVFGARYEIRAAQPPAPPTLLTRLFGQHRGPVQRSAVPATDGTTLWLPPLLRDIGRPLALQRYRTMALQQAMRAHRGSPALCAGGGDGRIDDIYLLLEACAADQALITLLPGTAEPLFELRRAALAARPQPAAFPQPLRELEAFARDLMSADFPAAAEPMLASPDHVMREARTVAAQLLPNGPERHGLRALRLFRDLWTGDLVAPPGPPGDVPEVAGKDSGEPDDEAPRGVHLERRPNVREARENEDDDPRDPGAWMVQADEPHEKAEDPMGVQRPTDRDDASEADELGEMLSELPEARLVSTPGRPKEVLISDDPPKSVARPMPPAGDRHASAARYPEWDYRAQRYRVPGATVRSLPPEPGSQAWVDNTLREHRAMLELIRRRFEMLQARRVVLRRQLDGEEIDLDSCVDALADLRAGACLPEALYQRCRPAERNLAIMLLIDVSGSTDGWVSSTRRIIDVEREALLLVCIALQELGEPYAVQAFSGQGPQGVTVRTVKNFDEGYSNDIALRISSLEPEHYTRAGAAIRHATALSMQQAASHRLLLLLSDGKPNDIDAYEGRYGAEDMRQAVIEAHLQGLSPFCLTIDRQAANYLPRIFGAHHYAMLPRPELLPGVLLDWMRRLLATR